MAVGPAPFSEIGKRAKDLLTKDYNFDHKFVFSSSNDSGLGLTATGIKVNEQFLGDISTQYRSGKTLVDVKVDTNSNISTTISVDELLAGAKTKLSFKLPDQKSGKLDVQYFHRLVAFNSSIGLTPTPLLEFAAAIGSRELSVGAEIGFDSASASLTKYNAGIGFNKHDFSAALVLTDKGETLKASYIHVLNPVNGVAVAAEMVRKFNTYENSFAIGSSHNLDPLTTIKTCFNNSGKSAVLCQHQWRPKSFITVSAEFDPKAASAPSRFGLALALKP
ncbi:mitochondrial outer membrane protein porin 6-like [Zingiber officinale]|uniref:mitochondrial outer membrane protein porin 6-like n=1 Tax=Zingiber officinale TaxID=94328 RepID=UPI001C4C5C43|nr:mitochondrial outer membrane protein porin 6-like [Zingiber officinale]XP_042461268.1 mitochondrial outer membrane protein porin 6-like [Zingiber officinale]XP_042461269.1 mitochondrial outer membrane protein porin 6-like [Zingiber officinale]XP_042461270.1 mitochondrial outer membrane protein porin 6-like [Zingiber officinale]